MSVKIFFIPHKRTDHRIFIIATLLQKTEFDAIVKKML